MIASNRQVPYAFLKSFEGVEPAMFGVSSRAICTPDWKDQMIWANDKKMLVKQPENSYLSVVNNTYTVIENKDWAVPIHEQMVKSFGVGMFIGDEHSCKTKATLSKNGAVTHVYYDFPDVSTDIETTNKHETQLKLRVIVKNTFDASSKVILYVGNIDTFCENGMITGQYHVMKQSHRGSFKVNDFTETFENALASWKEGNATYYKMAKTSIFPRDVWKLFFELDKKEPWEGMNVHGGVDAKYLGIDRTLAWKLYQRYIYDEVPVRGHNLFSVMSALTHYSSHNSPEFRMQKGNEDTIPSRLLSRQEKVAKWMNSNTWDRLVTQRIAA